MTTVTAGTARSVKALSVQGLSAGAVAVHVGLSTRTVERIRTRPDPFPAAITMPGDWADDALCAQTDPEIFFPDKGQPTRDAKAVCFRCPVRQQCLQFALTNGEAFGVYGGLSPRERRNLARPSS